MIPADQILTGLAGFFGFLALVLLGLAVWWAVARATAPKMRQPKIRHVGNVALSSPKAAQSPRTVDAWPAGFDLSDLPDDQILRVVPTRSAADELAKFIRETSPHPALRPANHSEKLNSSPAPEPASPWDDEITKVVTIVDPTEKRR